MQRTRYAHAQQNLRLYLSEATLPRMGFAAGSPPVPQNATVASHDFLLSSDADSRRKLSLILVFERAIIKKRIIKFLDASIPTTPIADNGRPFLPRAPSFFFKAFRNPQRVEDMRGMLEWMRLPLETVQHAMQLVWPEKTRRFRITEETIDDPNDAHIYRTYYWHHDQGIDLEDVHQSSYKVTIALMAPWALAPYDIENFIQVGQFPAFSIIRDPDSDNKIGHPASFQRVHRVWAKLWDDCTRKRCPYFVVSVYDIWLFGVFTRGWTMALVSEPIKRTDTRPSVLQWLVFWFASSMEFPGAWRPPRLARFDNPDIKDVSNVATKLSSEWTGEKMTPHEQWLKSHHHYEGTDKSARTVTVPGIADTWFTDFDHRAQ